MKKTIIVVEYDDGNVIESDWFIGNLNYKTIKNQAIDFMIINYDWTREQAEINYKQAGMVGIGMIEEVYKFNQSR